MSILTPVSLTTKPSDAGVLPRDLSKDRNPLVDLFRFFAAIGIVALHTFSHPPLVWVGMITRFAVPFYAAATVFYACPTTFDSYGNFALKRTKRILIPFVIWSFFYFFVRMGAAELLDTKTPTYGWEVLTSGTTHHLWFLPFCFGLTLCCQLITRVFSRRKLETLGTILLLGALTSWFIWPVNLARYGYTARLSGNCIGAVMLAIVCWIHQHRFERFRSIIALWSFVGFNVASLCLCFTGRILQVENLAGFLLFFSALNSRAFWRKRLASELGVLSFGIYLTHIAFVEGAQDVFHFAGYSESASTDTVIFVLASTMSIFLVWIARRVLPANICRLIGLM